MKNNFSLSLVAILLLSACAANHESVQGESIVLDKIAGIENDPITRMSFVAQENQQHQEIKVVIYDDKSNTELNDVMPASGESIPK